MRIGLWVKAACVCLLLSGLTACGSKSTSAAEEHPASTPSSTAPGKDQPSKASSPTPSHTVNSGSIAPFNSFSTFTTKASTGDVAKFEFTVYTPVKASLLDFNADPCRATLSTFGYSLSRALAVPIGVRGTPLSRLPVTLAEAVDSVFVLEGHGNVGGLQPPAWWLVPPGDDQMCAATTGGELAEQWNNLHHGFDGSVLGYILIPNAITPNDPKGVNSVAHYLAFRPSFTVGTERFADAPTTSSALVHCDGTQGTFALDWYIAAEPGYAVAAGCTRANTR